MNMKQMRKNVTAAMFFFGLVVAPITATVAMAQDAKPADLVDASGKPVDSNAPAKKGGGFFDIVFGSGAVGTILWFGLFGDAAAAIYFAVDCWVLVKPQKLMPQMLISNVQNAMQEGDVVKSVNSMLMTNRRRAEDMIASFATGAGSLFVLEIERDGKTFKQLYEFEDNTATEPPAP